MSNKINELRAKKENLKDLTREDLKDLTKEELIEIISDLALECYNKIEKPNKEK